MISHLQKRDQRRVTKKIDNGELFQLQKELQEADPQFYSTIDINNPRRILCGLEVYKTTGKPLSSFVGKQEGRLYKSAIIVLEMERYPVRQSK